MARQKYKDANGEPLPGVTTIIAQSDQGGLIAAANSMGLKGRAVYGPAGEWTRAADIGTAAHALIGAHLTGVPIEPKDFDAEVLRLAQLPYQSFLGWREGKSLDGASEVGLTHPGLFYGGTLDMLGKDYILDWKTSSSMRFQDGWYAQLAGYKILAEANGHGPILRMTVVRFPKEGGLAEELVIEGEKAEAGKDLFLSLLAAWKARKIINTKEKK